jgi:hypothetical protein
VRYWTIALLKIANNQTLLPLQKKALIIIQAQPDLFISKEVYHILTKRVQLPQLIPLLLNQVQVLYPSKYFKWWVRHIQDTTSLTREDAVILTYGTFSTTTAGNILGVETITTTDTNFDSEYNHQRKKLQTRLNSIVQNLGPPWNQARLPKMLVVKEKENL